MRRILFVFTALAVSFASLAQSGNIRGHIKTSDEQPAEFINVRINDSNKGGVTNNKGEFEIRNVEPGKHLLVISFVGLETKQLEVEVSANQTSIIPPVILNENARQLNEVVISERGGNPFERTTSEHVAKLPLKGLENPQVYNVITAELLASQVVTNFDDALKNAPGVEKLWESTGRGGDGAGYYSLRGFSVQPTMVNGLPGLTNGSLDPANIDAIEVIKGPSGTLFGGSLISYGGLINIVTKRPYHDRFGGEIAYTMGSFGLNRVTVDVNTPLNTDKDIAVRLVSAYHRENTFQDAGFRNSFFVAPSLSYHLNSRLSFLINTEFYNSEGTNPTMLFLNRSSKLEYSNLEELNYNRELSLTSNDITIKNPRYSLQGQMIYKISESWRSQTAISRSFAKSDGYYSYLWDNAASDNTFGLFVNDQNAITNASDIQQNFIGDFKLGTFRNRVVIGLDYFHREVFNNSSNYGWLQNVSPQGLELDPATGEPLPASNLSRTAIDDLLKGVGINKSHTKEAIYSAYISNVINFTPRLSLMASVRADRFDTNGEVGTEDDNYQQTALSPKFGFVYQPFLEKVSVFTNFMNGFNNVAPRDVTDANGINSTKVFKPEHANQWEVGIKTSLFSNRLNSSISYYDIRVSDRVFPDPENPNNSIQGGQVESKGIEIDVNANPINGLNLIMGYSFNESVVIEGPLESAFGEKGRRPGEAGPERLFNSWVNYGLSKGLLNGFGLGLGVNAASERVVIDSQATGKFVLPAYTILKASLFYNTDAFRATVTIDNLTNEDYYKGWSTINPQSPRRISASFAYKF